MDTNEDTENTAVHEEETVAKKPFSSLFKKSKKAKEATSSPRKNFGLYDKLFSPYARPKLHRFFILTFFVSVFYLSSRILGVIFISPEKMVEAPNTSGLIQSEDRTPENIKFLAENDYFKAYGKKVKDKEGEDELKPNEPVICLDANSKSSLPVTLLSTLVLQDTVKSLASVQVRGKQEILNIREGEKVGNLAEVGKISRRKLIFKNLSNGRCEYVENQEEAMSRKLSDALPEIISDKKQAQAVLDSQKQDKIQNEGNNYKIKKSLRNEMLSNISEVLTQARAIQIKNPDGTLAFKMQEVVPGSIYSLLNIQDGDVITAINGSKIKSLSELMNLFSQIKEIDHYEITRKRNGVEETLEYDFE